VPILFRRAWARHRQLQVKPVGGGPLASARSIRRASPSPSQGTHWHSPIPLFALPRISRRPLFFRRGRCRGPANRWIHIHHKEPQGKVRPARCSMSAWSCVCAGRLGPGCSWTAVSFFFGTGTPCWCWCCADKKNCPRPSNLRLTNRLDAWLFVTILFSMRFTTKCRQKNAAVCRQYKRIVRTCPRLLPSVNSTVKIVRLLEPAQSDD
jgi:hypothetical protein